MVKRQAEKEKKIVCYYTNWSVNRPGSAKFLPSFIDPHVCTHILYAFVGIDLNNVTIKIVDGQTLRDIEIGKMSDVRKGLHKDELLMHAIS